MNAHALRQITLSPRLYQSYLTLWTLDWLLWQRRLPNRIEQYGNQTPRQKERKRKCLMTFENVPFVDGSSKSKIVEINILAEKSPKRYSVPMKGVGIYVVIWWPVDMSVLTRLNKLICGNSDLSAEVCPYGFYGSLDKRMNVARQSCGRGWPMGLGDCSTTVALRLMSPWTAWRINGL